MTFSERLRKARENKGYSSKEVAAAIGVAASTYSQYETGSREPDVLKIKKISDFLDVSGDYLILGIDPKSKQNEFVLSDHEKNVISAYRNHPDMQPAVNKMLDIELENPKTIENDIVEELKQDAIKATANIK